MGLMFKGKIFLHQIVLFGVLGVLILRSIIVGSFVFNISILWWLLGAMVGFLFVFCDRVVNNLFLDSNNTLSSKIKEAFGKKSFAEGIKLLLAERYDQKELVMRSFLFLIVWDVLAFFAATSVINFFARGLILGIGTHLIFDLIYDYVQDKDRLDQWFWQIKRTLEVEEKKWFVVISVIVYILLAFFL